MNYYGARQVDPTADRVDAGKYRFTVRNDDRIWATGACAGDCDAHDTPEEACQHWVEGEIAGGVIWGECSWTSCDHRAACDEPARKVARIAGEHGFYTLCGTHATDEQAAELFREDHQGAFQIASSW